MAEAQRQRPDEFYVGYLPMPAGHLRFVRIAVPVLLWLMVVCGVVFAILERRPGDAVWEDGKTVDIVGVVHERPYPYLVPTTGDAKPVFLVEQGKHGAAARMRGREGQSIRATGFRLSRDGREILELDGAESAVAAVQGVVPVQAAAHDLGDVTLRGEIVDYKCYLGAMKPGDGKGHKACAALCISGGIPPMLVGFEGGGPTYTVLVGHGGGESFAPLAGEPVLVSGRLQELGGLRVLLTSAARVVRD
jgi:hypothetical protein